MCTVFSTLFCMLPSEEFEVCLDKWQRYWLKHIELRASYHCLIAYRKQDNVIAMFIERSCDTLFLDWISWTVMRQKFESTYFHCLSLNIQWAFGRNCCWGKKWDDMAEIPSLEPNPRMVNIETFCQQSLTIGVWGVKTDTAKTSKSKCTVVSLNISIL